MGGAGKSPGARGLDELSELELDRYRDIEAEIDEYRVAFLKVFPGLRYSDVDEMPFWLWEACRDEVDRLGG